MKFSKLILDAHSVFWSHLPELLLMTPPIPASTPFQLQFFFFFLKKNPLSLVCDLHILTGVELPTRVSLAFQGAMFLKKDEAPLLLEPSSINGSSGWRPGGTYESVPALG